MDLKTITVQWMDGQQETYSNVVLSVREGVLHIHQYKTDTHALAREWHHPLSNIRTWQPAGQEA